MPPYGRSLNIVGLATQLFGDYVQVCLRIAHYVLPYLWHQKNSIFLISMFSTSWFFWTLFGSS